MTHPGPVNDAMKHGEAVPPVEVAPSLLEHAVRGSLRRHMRSPTLCFGALCAAVLASGPACTPPPAPPAPPHATPRTPPQATAEAPPPAPPVLVIQAFGEAERFAGRRIDLAPSPDGALVASWGPDLVVVDARTGDVRGRLPEPDGGVLPGCALAAVFLPDSAHVAVLRCPVRPAPPLSAATPDADVELWDLATDTTKRLASGPFDHVALSADRSALLLWGEHEARSVDLATGEARASVALTSPGGGSQPDRIEQMGARGDRALATVGDDHVVLRAGQPPIPVGTRWSVSGALSADLRRQATMDGDTLVVKELDTGRAVQTKPLGDRCKPLALDTAGDRVAVSCTEPDGVHLAAFGVDGHPLCTWKPSVPRSTWFDAARFSIDGERLALVFRGMKDPNDVAVGVYQSQGCATASGGSQALWWYLAASSDDLGAIASFEHGDGPLAGTMRVMRAGSEPALSVIRARRAPPFERDAGDLLVVRGDTTDTTWSPRRAALEHRPATTSGGVVLADGRTLQLEPKEPSAALRPVASIMPVSGEGRLVLVDAGGKRLPLQKSEEIVAELGPWQGCQTGKRGTHVACVWTDHVNRSVDEEAGELVVAVWETKKGRRVLQRKGGGGRLSPDETQVVLVQDRGAERTFTVVDVATDKPVASFTGRPTSGTTFDWIGQFGPDGAGLALDGIGMVDTKGKLRWATKQGFAAWTPGGDAVVLRREEGWTSSGPVGRLEVRNAKNGELVTTLDDDSEVVDLAPGGKLALTRDPTGIHRVRKLDDWKVLWTVGRAYSATFSEDGGFVYAQGNGPLRIVRMADGEQLFQVLPASPSSRGLVLTPTGLFDGDDAGLALVKYRSGGVVSGRLLPWNEVHPEARKEGLLAAFFAGEAVSK